MCNTLWMYLCYDSTAMPDEIFGPDTICISSIENYFINYAEMQTAFIGVALILALWRSDSSC